MFAFGVGRSVGARGCDATKTLYDLPDGEHLR